MSGYISDSFLSSGVSIEKGTTGLRTIAKSEFNSIFTLA